MSKNFASNGSALTIFVPHASDLLTDHQAHGDGLIAYEIVSRLASRGHQVYVAAPRIDVRGEVPPSLHLRQIGHEDGSLALHNVRRLVDTRKYFREVSARRRIDIVHQLNPVFTGVSLALLGCNVPIVLGSYVSHWPDVDHSLNAFQKLRSKAFEIARSLIASEQQRLATALLIATPAAMTRIVRPERDRSKVQILPHSLDPALYAVANREDPPTDAPTILYLGSLERRKGVDVLLRAFEIVAAEIPSANLIIAGTGPLQGEIEKSLRQIGLRARVSLIGHVEREEVPVVLRSATLVCVPSLGEPFGMSLLEAMASERPVVVTDAGGPRDIVDESGGLRVPCGDSMALGAALIEMLRSKDLRKMGSYNRQVVVDRYSWDRTITNLEEIYYRVLRSRQSY